MAYIEQSIRISAPLADVFDYVSDYQHALEWMDGFEEFRLVGKRARGVGAKVRASGRYFGVTVTTILEIVEWVENDHFTSISDGLVSSTTTWAFAPTEDGTVVTYSGTYKLNGLPVAFIGERILEMEVGGNITRSLTRLKQVMGTRPG